MKISRYVRRMDDENDIVLYNTIDHAIIQLPKEAMNGDEILDVLDDESKSALKEMRFTSETDEAVKKEIPSYLINKDKLFISIELNLSCNLRCPYCYQAGMHTGKVMDDRSLDCIVEYVKAVHKKEEFSELFVKILGGEPTLVWHKFNKIYSELTALCQEKKIKMHLLVDTNGTLIDDLLTLDGYDSLLFTIPLTYKMCHDDVRRDARGNGTYDLIVDNINRIKRTKPEAKIVLRYNVDKNNVDYFKDFLQDINTRLTFKPLVSVNYTAEFNESDEFGNGMSYAEFVDWSSTKAIDALAAHRMPITISPVISIEECQYRSRYSLKVFSDGTVGSCAMSFFDQDRLRIADLVDGFEKENSFKKDKERQTVLADEECMQCDSIFLCGGTNKLPCIKALAPDLCAKKKFGINLELFIKRYLKYQEDGISDLFVVFEDGESYR